MYNSYLTWRSLRGNTLIIKLKFMYTVTGLSTGENIIYCRYPSEAEFLLRSVPPLMHESKRKKRNIFDPTCSSYECPKPKQLPPLIVKPQVISINRE